MQALDRKDAEADANSRRLLNKCCDGSCDCSSDRLGSIVLRKFNFYRHNNQISVVIEPGAERGWPVNARLCRNELPKQFRWGRGRVALVHRCRRISPPTYNTKLRRA